MIILSAKETRQQRQCGKDGWAELEQVQCNNGHPVLRLTSQTSEK